MKLRKEITINADHETVWRIFDDPEHTRKWQPELKSKTLLSGEPDQVGAKYELVYDHNGRDMRVVSTLTEIRKFEVATTVLESDWGQTTITYHFESISSNQTRWVLEIEYRFKGFYRLVAVFLRKNMLARGDEEMQRLKELVESVATTK